MAAVWIALLLLLSGACAPSEQPVRLVFDAVAGGRSVACGDDAGLGLRDLRFYVHDVRRIDAGGRQHPVRLVEDGRWQGGGVALLDFEDGTGSCDQGTAGVRTVVEGKAGGDGWHGLAFVLGVPFDVNHADPVRAPPPLTLGRMHWGWQAGFKFLRFEAGANGRARRLHLGSTGCRGTVGAITGCARPNRVEVLLPVFDPARHRVVVDLDALIASLDSGVPEPGAGGCLSAVDEPACAGAFAVLGLDLATGRPSTPQHLFRLAPRGSAG